MSDMEISSRQLADLTGVTIRTLRHYHSIELLPEPARTKGGYRTYTFEHVLQILRIKRLTGLGLSLDQVSEILESPESPSSDLMLRNLDRTLADKITQMRDQRRTISAMRQSSTSIDVLPEYASHITALRLLGTVDRSIETGKMLIDLVAGIGTEQDSEHLLRLLDAMTTDVNAEHLVALDTRFHRIDSAATEDERQSLAIDYGHVLTAFYISYNHGDEAAQWSAESPLEQLLTDLTNSQYNDVQRDIIQHATKLFSEEIDRQTNPVSETHSKSV